jgi:hypothetical protein
METESQGDVSVDGRTAGPALRLVADDRCEAGASVVLVAGDAAEKTKIRRLLASEALALEAQFGKNPYSDYLLHHHRRPDRAEAATIGRLLGGRVKAADGTLQPPLTEADRLALRGIKARRIAASRRYDQILRLREAIAALSQNKDDPADIIAGGSVLFDCPEIGSQLDSALCWLNRFAKEWYGREKAPCPGSTKPIGRP